jgi:mRNA interferase HigB
MRIIKESRLREYAKLHSKASAYLNHWRDTVRKALWKKFVDIGQTLKSSADQMTLPNGRRVVVFDVCGGAFRLVTAIHYNRGIVYIRRFMTHAEYSKGDWKNDP